MTLEEFLQKLEQSPAAVTFDETQSIIDQYYHYTPTAFINGDIKNNAGENSGSCRLFAFGKLHSLTEEQVLHCFGDYYRDNVLGNPEGNDHRNIRQFMKSGWTGIRFQDAALAPAGNNND